MSLTTIEHLLEEKIGLSVETVGSETIVSAIRRRMEECGIDDIAEYLVYLNTSDTEWDELIEAVIVPETWFFRNEESFAFLGWYVRSEWMPTHKNDILRMLSIPCSTGEEPYSIAITVLNVGLSNDRFSIDAVDISRKGLQKAQRGIYGQESFRKQTTLQFLERYFAPKSGGYQINSSIRDSVRFMWGNLLDDNILSDAEPYDIIFCRNLLIYLSASGKKQAIYVLDKLLAETGILFVGHAERPAFNGSDFVWIRRSGVFACQRTRVSQKPQKQVQPEEIHKTQKQEKKNRIVAKRPASASYSSQILTGAKRNTPVPHNLQPTKDTPKLDDEVMSLLDEAQHLADQGDLEEALRLCKKSLKQSATNVQCHFLMGLIYQALGDEKRAEESLNKVVYLDPNHQEALSYMAFIATRRGDQNKAMLLRQRMKRIQKKLKTSTEGVRN